MLRRPTFSDAPARKLASSAAAFLLLITVPSVGRAQVAETPDFATQIEPIFATYCAGCHAGDEREGGFSVESFSALAEGGDSGPAILPSDLDGSRLWRLTAGLEEPRMPPEGTDGPNEAELELLKAWIKGGAPGPSGEEPQPKRLVVPSLPAAPQADAPLLAVAYSPDGQHIAVARYGRAEVIKPSTGEITATFGDLPGKVNALEFSADSRTLVTASGVAGLYGQVDLWDLESLSQTRSFRDHRDALLAVALDPAGHRVATAGYDRKILIRDVASGDVITQLEGHNGAIYDLQFDSTGELLLSASADATLKVWRVADGVRLDTLGQPLKEQFVGAFSPDRAWIYGAGADNRIRRWKLVSTANPEINPLETARFAHEGPIVALAISSNGQVLATAAEDRTLKLWNAQDLTEIQFLPNQSEIVTGLSFSPDARQLVVVRLDGTRDVLEVPQIETAPAETTAEVNVSDMPTVTMPEAPMAELAEAEPNDSPDTAQIIALPAQVKGVIRPAAEGTSDFDLYRITARKGEAWMIEINAARTGSKLDSFVEVLDMQGKPVPRVLLQAVRDSYFTFRGKDSDTSDDFRVHNWEEMELNEYLYAAGEVVQLWLYPRGPDSGYKVYPGFGKRYTYFDTTAVAHALGEPCYIVKPHPVGTNLIPNGLPTFELPYQNDDDARRRWGADSSLSFVAPADGEYLVRVRDARGFGGDDYAYTLSIRPRRQDFAVSIGGRDPKVPPGCGREFTVNAERFDDFEGPISITLEGLPPGFHATSPVVIEPGQMNAVGLIWADDTAVAPTAEQSAAIRVVASAEINGQKVEHDLGGIGTLALDAPPSVRIRIAQVAGEVTSADALVMEEGPAELPWPGDAPLELTIAPGTTIAAQVFVERRGHEGGVPFGNEDSGRNLPHGVFIDNIGLNGLLVIEGRSERVFFITASKIAAEQSQYFHLKARVGGEPCSLPVLLHIKRTGAAGADDEVASQPPAIETNSDTP